MTIEQIYTNCLAQGAYYITSNGEAAIIDPLRETKPYLERLERDNMKLKYIFETHFHADFVSGHLDLSQKTNATVVFGPDANFDFDVTFDKNFGTKLPVISAKDNQIFEIGHIKIKVLHTPGHTLESSCFLLIDENGKENALFSGDTLFIGDVGRPDLAQKSATMTQEQLAAILYHSLRTKIMILPDDVLVYPAHGAGSACGKNMSKETFSTIGIQKQLNYALRSNMTENEFVEEVTDGLLPAPAYFGMNVAMNKNGYESFDRILHNGMKAVELAQFEIIAEANNALILDTRSNGDFALGFVPQAINIGIVGDFAPWVGAMIGDVKQPILLITEIGKEEETVTRLTRVGFDNILGHLKGGFEAWKNAGKEIDKVNRITADQFNDAYFTEISIEQHPDKDGDFGRKRSKIIDVRKIGEYETEHIEEAFSRPLANINEWIKEVNPWEHFFLHCAGGYRSMIAASILKARGYKNFTEIEGGFNAIAKTTIPRSKFMCQSKV